MDKVIRCSIPFFLLTLILVSSGCQQAVESPPSPTPPPTSPPPPTPTATVAPEPIPQLGRGVNLGNALEAPREGEWGVTLQVEYFALIKKAGFDSVRIPIRWSTHADKSAPYTIDPAFFERVDWAVEQSLSRDLLVVINMHHYEEIFQSPDEHAERFIAMWKQIAEHYRDYPSTLLFEPLNEPHGRLTAPKWNSLLADVLAVIRETNPDRYVIVGPVSWNNITALSSLELPADDRRIIVTFHYYDPFQFTHQGAEWVSDSDAWMGTKWEGTPGEQRAVTLSLTQAANWGKAHDRPLYMGEFGAYSKADMDSRARWTAFVARQAEELGMSWAYWEFCSGFGVFDKATGKWNEPIRDALIPPE